MFKIYKGQSSLRISLKTFVDLEGINAAYIKYKKSDKTTGVWKAGVSDVHNGEIFYECAENDIDKSGWWSFWAFVEFADGRSAAGEAAKVYVWNEGE